MTVIDKAKFRQTVFELIENDDSLLAFPKGNIEVIEGLTLGFLDGLIAVHYDPEANSLKWLSLEALREFMRAHTELAERDSPKRMYDLIRGFETEIRGFIGSKMCERFSDSWVKRGVPKDIRKNWNSRRQSDTNLGKPPEATMIDYADFSDYKKIIMYNWKEVFSRYFKDKEKLRIRLDDLDNFCRKTVMHMRTITYGEVGVAEVSIRWLKSKMRMKTEG